MGEHKKDRDIIFAEHVAVAVIHLIFAAIISLTIITTVTRFLGF